MLLKSDRFSSRPSCMYTSQISWATLGDHIESVKITSMEKESTIVPGKKALFETQK